MKTVIISANTSRYLLNYRRNTILKFIENGFHVICISSKDDCTDALKDIGCQWLNLKINSKGNNPFTDMRVFFRLFYIYLKYQPKASFHFNIKYNIYGTWAAFFSNTPAINNVSGLGTAFIHKNFISSIVKILYKLSQPLAYRVYCQNEEDFNLLIREKLVPRHKLFLLPGSGVDIKRFKPSLQLEKEDIFTFLYAGRMLADKGLYELIDVMIKINKDKIIANLWICAITNNDNLSAIPQEDIEKWKSIPGIVWLEPNNNNIEHVMKHVSCIVLPSYREGLSKTLLEGGAMGLPCIATDVPGCKDVIQDNKSGFLCKARDSKSLELAMLKVIDLSQKDLLDMGGRARKIIEEKFDEKIVIDAALEALNSV